MLFQNEELESLGDSSGALELIEQIAGFVSLALDELLGEESQEENVSVLIVEAFGLKF